MFKFHLIPLKTEVRKNFADCKNATYTEQIHTGMFSLTIDDNPTVYVDTDKLCEILNNRFSPKPVELVEHNGFMIGKDVLEAAKIRRQ